jgi:hypothetical protein
MRHRVTARRQRTVIVLALRDNNAQVNFWTEPAQKNA